MAPLDLDPTDPRARAFRALRVAAAVAALICLFHGLSQGIGAAAYWWPCVVDGGGSAGCAYAIDEAPTPWWWSLAVLWVVEFLLAIPIGLLALFSGRRRIAASTAFACVVMSNVVVDQLVAPLLNRGLDAALPPGFGVTGGVLLTIAGVIYAVIAARR